MSMTGMICCQTPTAHFIHCKVTVQLTLRAFKHMATWSFMPFGLASTAVKAWLCTRAHSYKDKESIMSQYFFLLPLSKCPGLCFSSGVTGLHVGLLGGRRRRVRRGGDGVTWAVRVLERAGHVIPVFPSYGVLLLGQELTELKNTNRCESVSSTKSRLFIIEMYQDTMHAGNQDSDEKIQNKWNLN